MKKIKRIYHHAELLEEAPMWGNCKPSETEILITKSFNLLSNIELFINACHDVIVKWPYSSEHNLSARVQNRKAWMGQAACYVSHQSTEYTTRQAWRMLSDEQQNEANMAAQIVIEEWERCQR
jgi:hypothetical protein